MNELRTRYDVVVVAAGEMPKSSLANCILRNAAHVVACDGALESLLLQGIEPEAVIGDGDSITPRLKEKYKSIYHQVDEQEYNDLTKATQYALSHFDLGEKPAFCYLGAMGKREDHTLGNLSLLLHYYTHLHIVPVMVSDYGWFVPAKGSNSFASFPHQQVSIFQVDCKQLSSVGLKWEIYPFRELWQGTLNEAVGDSFAIEADGTYLVYRTHQPK
ncbi:UNVERIFIED_CONTAM: thiamine diphosphokinase [Prevotella sp. 15_C9]